MKDKIQVTDYFQQEKKASKIFTEEPGMSIVTDLKNRFKFHPATGDKAEKHEFIRNEIFGIAVELTDVCPESRELSLAITKLEEAMFWANAAIARNS